MEEKVDSSFDAYAAHYAEVINAGARASGESHEFMVALRVGFFARECAELLAGEAAPAVLDFGCGTGLTAECLARRFPRAAIRGFDTSAESIETARARGIAGAEFTCGRSASLPWGDASFDAIYSNGTFHHIPVAERSEWLMDLARVLKPGGTLVVFENNPLNPLMMQAMRRTPFDADAVPIGARDLRTLIGASGVAALPPRFYFFFPRWLKWLRCLEGALRRVPLGAQYYVKGVKKKGI